MDEPNKNTGKYVGLKKTELPFLRKKFGKNIFTADQKNSTLYLLWGIVTEPMFLILSGACSLYFILGEVHEGALMLVAMAFVAAISFYQEIKSNKALAILKQYTEPAITVIREGVEEVILSEELLPGDIMIVEEGNRIPADATVVQANDLSINEAIITGESFPVEKNTSEKSNFLFQGTTVNSGKCFAIVTAIGNKTVLGKLGKSVSSAMPPKTLLQKQIGRFVRVMAVIGSTAFLLIWLINFINSGNLVQSLLIGLTLIMSAIPEEIPVAFSSFMALGAAKMAKLGIITKQPQTIENLGAVSTICLDKTGTITENKMQVKMIYDFRSDQVEELSENKLNGNSNILFHARLASESAPFDSMEKAIIEAYRKYIDNDDQANFNIVHEYPLGGMPPMMTHVHEIQGRMYIVAKGAPERIIRVCRLSYSEKDKIDAVIDNMSSSGYRVLGICSAPEHSGSFPDQQDDFKWHFDGLLALYDPPKKNTAGIIGKWLRAGITVKLLTGDFAQTAINIARLSGIENTSAYISGEEVMRLSDAELNEKMKGVNIYARMFPEAKLKVIEVLKKNNEIVAMTGDGVNDGPALRSAHIGIAMGNRGTEIAKEAADLVITDDNLDKITEAIQQGRKIYSNLKKAIRYIISIHIPIICTASLPLVLGWKYPNIFTPVHVIFLELIMGPTCSVFYEREPVEGDIMNKKPRQRKQNIFSAKELILSFIQGAAIAGGILFLYYFFMEKKYSIEYVRTIVFTTLISSNIFLTFVNRSFHETVLKTFRYKNSLAVYIILLSFFFLTLIYFIQPIRATFQLTTLSWFHYLVCLLTSLVITGWVEFYKSYLQKLNIPDRKLLP
ncbi:MAG: cation-translocating P-type ATPase [Bacteroidetes bacterium]|nr:cation-translocating P-type ATPase [Bacteroidota bacterium]